MVVIAVDMERPWNIMKELEKWANALEDYIKSMDIEVEEMQEYKDSRKHIYNTFMTLLLFLLWDGWKTWRPFVLFTNGQLGKSL